jgi:hypothetical protein
VTAVFNVVNAALPRSYRIDADRWAYNAVGAAALVACYLPARRAAAVDPFIVYAASRAVWRPQSTP